MKKWVHSYSCDEISSSKRVTKLKRTYESGHSYEGDITFDNADEMLRWCKEDALYED